jgi:nucleotide-binding universal stress UspA family protein
VNLRHIVIATDESDAGRQAVATGLELAERATARITIMRVVPPGAEPHLETFRDGVAWPSLGGDGVEFGIAFGVPGIEICRFAEHRSADLLVLGRKRRSPMARMLVGDTADAVIRRSRVPCLFVQPGAGPIRRLLVALDGTGRGRQVLDAVRGLAAAVGATIRVVTVVEDEPVLVAAGFQDAGRPVVEGVELALRRGVIVPEILAEVAGSDPDVLAFGYHRGGPPGIIENGSTARQLTHAAPVTVLAIPL